MDIPPEPIRYFASSITTASSAFIVVAGIFIAIILAFHDKEFIKGKGNILGWLLISVVAGALSITTALILNTDVEDKFLGFLPIDITQKIMVSVIAIQVLTLGIPILILVNRMSKYDKSLK